jgi:hypothetical protein
MRDLVAAAAGLERISSFDFELLRVPTRDCLVMHVSIGAVPYGIWYYPRLWIRFFLLLESHFFDRFAPMDQTWRFPRNGSAFPVHWNRDLLA